MTKEEYKKAKVSVLALPAALILLAIQGYAFLTGLHVGFDGLDWIVGAGMFFTLLAIQLIGNDLSFDDDEVFYIGWLFSYIVEISAGTWTFYNVFTIPNEYMRWGLAFGVSGVVAILPERLIFLWVNNRKKRVDTVSKYETKKPANNLADLKNKYKLPSHNNGGKPAQNNNAFNKSSKFQPMQSYKPQTNTTRVEPTYRPLNIQPKDINKWDEE